MAKVPNDNGHHAIKDARKCELDNGKIKQETEYCSRIIEYIIFVGE
jgi:hypothetical protein